MEKCAGVRVLETELKDDSPGVCMKLSGRLGDIEAAARAAEETAGAMQTAILAHVIPSHSELSPRRLPGPAGVQSPDRAGNGAKTGERYERSIQFCRGSH